MAGQCLSANKFRATKFAVDMTVSFFHLSLTMRRICRVARKRNTALLAEHLGLFGRRCHLVSAAIDGELSTELIWHRVDNETSSVVTR